MHFKQAEKYCPTIDPFQNPSKHKPDHKSSDFNCAEKPKPLTSTNANINTHIQRTLKQRQYFAMVFLLYDCCTDHHGVKLFQKSLFLNILLTVLGIWCINKVSYSLFLINCDVVVLLRAALCVDVLKLFLLFLISNPNLFLSMSHSFITVTLIGFKFWMSAPK